MANNFMKEAEELYAEYTGETSGISDKYAKKITPLKNEIAKIKKTDYTKEYVDMYKASLESLTEIFDGWDSVQKRTKGIDFRVADYIKQCKPAAIPKGQIESFFDALVKECRAAIVSVSNSRSVEDDIEPQKKFCRSLVNLRYIVNNADKLLADAGIQERSLAEELREPTEKLNELNAKYKEESKIEKLRCYPHMMKFKEKVMDEYESMSEKLVGAQISNEDPTYRFLMGFAKSEDSPELLNFTKKVIGIPDEAFATIPVYFEPKDSNDVIIIRADGEFLESEECMRLVLNMYFSMISSLPPRNLLFGGAEITTESVIGAVATRVENNLSPSLVFNSKIAESPQDTDQLIERLRILLKERSDIYRANDDVTDIYEYNEATPDNQHQFVMCCFNNLPDCLADTRKNTAQNLLEILKKGGSKGIISIICENTDKTNDLDLSSVKADVITVKGNNVLYNGKQISTDITTQQFKASEYWKMLKERMEQSSSLSLDKLLQKADKRFGGKSPKPFTDKICVPIGMSDNEWFDYTVKTCSKECFGIITGTTGSGKSSFLHTFILSMSYFYPPDELWLYLVDFKSGDDSPEFSNYRKSDKENLYIPHVRYLSLKNKKESAMDLLGKIESIIKERSHVMSKFNISEMSSYNKLPEVTSGKEPKMPQIFFIIDEYNSMFDTSGDAMAMSDQVASKLQTIINRARAYGIGIFFSGQYVDPSLKSTTLEQIGSRISLDVGSAQALRRSFTFSDISDADKYAEALLVKGNALFSTEGGSHPGLVRLAYSGKTGREQQLNIAKKIREKYKNNPACNFVQIEAGAESAFPITESGSCADGYADSVKKNFYLPIGVSSTSSLKVALRFAQNKNASNYVAFAEAEKLFALETNAVLSFIDKYKGKERLIYCSSRANVKSCFAHYGSEENFISSFVERADDKALMSEKVMSLLDTYNERKKLSEDGDIEFHPIFMVMHDIEWLFDTSSGIINTAPAQKVEKKEPALDKDAQKVSQEAAKSGVNISGKLASLVSGMAKKPSVTPEQAASAPKRTSYSVSEIKEAVLTLHASGNRYGIFVLLASETYAPVKKILAKDDEKVFARYTVYGSFDQMNGNKPSSDSDASCVYACPDNSKTRLFDYDPSVYKDWWKEFKNRISKGGKV